MESESFYGNETEIIAKVYQRLNAECNSWLTQHYRQTIYIYKHMYMCVYLTAIILLGVTLSEKEPIAQFDVPEIPEEYIVHSHKLIIKQISLGPEAKSGEFNVVQVWKNTDQHFDRALSGQKGAERL